MPKNPTLEDVREMTDGPPTPPAGSEASPSPSDRGRRGADGSPMKKVTVALVDRAADALDEVCDLTGGSKTDVINRAVQLYAFVERRLQAGDTLRLIDKDGVMRDVYLF